MKSSLNNISANSKVAIPLQEELVKYGIVRRQAAKEAPYREGGKPNFFGIKDYAGEDVELVFDSNVENLMDEDMTLGLVAPDDVSFDMLATTNFPEAVKRKDPESLRRYLRKILDEA